MAPVLEGKSIGSGQKTVLKGELLIWRTKNQAKDPGTLQLKDSIYFTRVQIGSYEIRPWTLVKSEPHGVLLQDPFDSFSGLPQPARLTSGAKCKHVGSEI
jgi:hypothetical protein